MPHIVIEYSANLQDKLNAPGLLEAVREAVLATGIFRIGGVRIRAYEAEHYLIADGERCNAFVHFNLKVGHGRDLSARQKACESIFDAVCRYLAPLSDMLPFAISLEMQEIDPVLTFKKNNLHEYVEQRLGHAAES